MRPDGPRDPVAGPEAGPEHPFPIKVSGKVVSGFGRGSRELGIPTANIPIEGVAVGGHSDIESGVYYGWAGLNLVPPKGDEAAAESGVLEPTTSSAASGAINGTAVAKVDTGTVFPMVMSIGWNPFYKNEKRSVEVHVIHQFPEGYEFYGRDLNLSILGFIRPEYDYVSKEALIEDIMTDIQVAKNSLSRDGYAKWKEDDYLLTFPEA